MLTVVCWRWQPRAGYRSRYAPQTVNVLRRMVARHYAAPHRFVCVTDDPAGIDPEVEVLPDFGDFLDVPAPSGPRNPSCYRRLRLFHPDAAQWFGDRFVSLDLDTVIVDDVAPLWDRPEDFIIWGDTNPRTFYNGSMLLLRAGARPQVWTGFHPQRSPAAATAAGHFGSDQGWISHCLGPNETKWSCADGVYSFRIHLMESRKLPAGARLVSFHGHTDPWSPQAVHWPWIAEHYR